MDSLISLSNSLISRRGPQSRLCLSVDWAGLENPGSLSETKSKSVPCSFTSNWDHKVFSQSAAPDSTTWSLWVVLHSAVNWLCRVFSCSCKDLTISSLVCPISCLFWAVSSATLSTAYTMAFPFPGHNFCSFSIVVILSATALRLCQLFWSQVIPCGEGHALYYFSFSVAGV